MYIADAYMYIADAYMYVCLPYIYAFPSSQSHTTTGVTKTQLQVYNYGGVVCSTSFEL